LETLERENRVLRTKNKLPERSKRGTGKTSEGSFRKGGKRYD